MKLNIGKLIAGFGRVAVGALKNPAGTVATVTTIALAVNQVVEGVSTIRTAVKPKGR